MRDDEYFSKEYLSIALRNLNSVEELTDTILDYSSQAAGVTTCSPEELRLSDCVKETIHRYSVSAAIKKIVLSFSVDPTIKVRCDSQHLSRILGNILSNRHQIQSVWKYIPNRNLGR